MNIFNRDPNKYKVISTPNLSILRKKYAKVWKDNTFPQKQWNRVEKQLEHIDDIPEFRAIIDNVRATKLKNPSILDIGCSSGYLSEVLRRSGIKSRYDGTDYSPSFIDFAKEKYPKIKFMVNDATSLKYKKGSFDIVVSGCCLLHIVNYKKAVSEAARVSEKYVIFHRTPVFNLQPTTFFTKTAYGAEMLEIIFNEDELIDIFCKNNMAVVKTVTISSGNISDLGENISIKNYLCRLF